jgi:hypothetical protein
MLLSVRIGFKSYETIEYLFLINIYHTLCYDGCSHYKI